MINLALAHQSLAKFVEAEELYRWPLNLVKECIIDDKESVIATEVNSGLGTILVGAGRLAEIIRQT